VLLDFGTPVQYSVFECLLSRKEINQMKNAVFKVIRPRADRVRFYYLCYNCVKNVEVTSGKEVLSNSSIAIIVD
jgi:CRISPR-associated protein Cas2